MAWTMKKLALVVGGAAVGGTACYLTAGFAAPAVGAMIGNLLGLSGAAATNAGLATLGGGAIAAGGGGMAAGATLVTTCLTGAGTLLGGLGMGTMANFFKDSNKEFQHAIREQKNYAKAQSIITDQEKRIRSLRQTLQAEKSKAQKNQEKIDKLGEIISKLEKVVTTERQQLAEAKAS